MLKKLGDLIGIKKIIALLITIVFCIMALRKDISSEQSMTIITVVISFYFAKGYSENKN